MWNGISPENYNKALQNNITKNYKKTDNDTINKITANDQQIAQQLELDDRIEQTARRDAFITIKDHKPNFPNNPTHRLINPTKPELGKVSKHILEKINKTLRTKTHATLWRNTTEVIDWFKNIANKQNYSFISFDVCEFYPSITHELLTNAIRFARQYTTITDNEEHIIIHTKNAYLTYGQETWRKKDNASMFDVTMGSYDGAETCELVGTYLLSLLPDELKRNTGLYRDDGLAICDGTPRSIENMKKQICKTFKQNKLKITIEANQKIINFLDVTLDLNSGTHSPYTKPNNNIQYVHAQSNHPPNIIKNLPENVNKRLSRLSANKHIFEQSKTPYQQALNDSNYKYRLKYKPETTTKKRNRQRKVIWYNPPYNSNVQTNIGKIFLKIVNKCFDKKNPLGKIFNKNTVKIS
ncbi:uncharacterized protein [Watersipora subatra]|uniref:uncharacterized protein n=1 Tax=Watersipora subatra TaxID=2589382 RepID=UPI00355C5848